jgi:hypothetical protein
MIDDIFHSEANLRNTVARRCLVACAAASVVLTVLQVTYPAPATAVTQGGPGAEVMGLEYSAPDLQPGGDTVRWQWTLRNGSSAVQKVVLLQQVIPSYKVTSVSKPCRILATAIRCEYGEMKARQQMRGAVVVGLPADIVGPVQIKGWVTWFRTATATAPR